MIAGISPTLSPPAPTASQIDAALALIASLSNPSATKAHLEKLSHATAEHDRAAVDAADRLAEVNAKLAEIEHREKGLNDRLAGEADDLRRMRAEHDERLARADRDHAETIGARTKAIDQRDAKLAAAEARCAELAAKLEQKLVLVRSLAG
jgi:hypothetical protein